MRPGPQAYDVRSLGLGVRLSSRRDREVLAVDMPASDVLLEWTADRDVPGKLSFSLPLDWLPEDPYAPVANFGQRVNAVAIIDAGGHVSEVPIGEFLITSWAEESDKVSVEALDLLQILAENPMPFPSSPPSGATLFSELKRLCVGLPVMMDVPDMPVPRDLQYGFDRVEAVRDLCAALKVQYMVFPDGYLHVFTRSSRDVVGDYSAEDVLVDAFRTSPERRANRILVVGTDESGAHSMVNVNFPPFDFAGYGQVTKRVENQAATTSSQARAVAEGLARDIGNVTRKRSFSIAPDPLLEGGDVVAVRTANEIVVGRVVAYSLPLSDSKASMRVDMEVLEW